MSKQKEIKLKVLIVDDSEQTLYKLKVLLENNYDVLTAKGSLEGLKLFSENTDIKLIITDYNMPHMDGFAMLQEMRLQPHYQKAYVIVMTTETSLELKQRGKKLGVQIWMVKPPSDNLLEIIRKIG